MSDEPPPAPDEIDFYWRPGCMFCSALRRKVERSGIPVRYHDIWEDPAAAAVVRRAAGGNETVPTVVVGGEALVNPSIGAVRALVRQLAPHLDVEPARPRRRFLPWTST